MRHLMVHLKGIAMEFCGQSSFFLHILERWRTEFNIDFIDVKKRLYGEFGGSSKPYSQIIYKNIVLFN